jgi:ceramide glucosyltransferase
MISHEVLEAIVVLMAYSSIAYVALAIWRVLELYERRQVQCQNSPPITILKPVCGLEPSLRENLRSFCVQDYAVYEVVFGVSDPRDPAIAVIEGLIEEFPHRELSLVVVSRRGSVNPKVRKLVDMQAHARHDILVVADSDIRVRPDYLRALAAAFEDPGVGAATCLYRGAPCGNLPSILSSMFINEWFFPAVHIDLLLEPLRFCLGATMAVRRDVLEAIGGFEALESYLADEYMLGKLTSDHGYKVELSPYIVDVTVNEPTLRDLFLHEIRWARTIRSVRPIKFALTFLTDVLPLSILVALAVDLDASGLCLVGLALALRIRLHYAVRVPLGVVGPARPWLVPVRDLLSFAVRIASFCGNSVSWRDNRYRVSPDGQMLVAQLTKEPRPS